MSVLLPAHACARLLGSEVEEAVCRARHGIRGGLAERKMLLPLLLPVWTVGMRFSRVQGGRVPKANQLTAGSRRKRGKIKKKAGQKLEGNVPPARVSALCRLPSDATHSVHYNKAVVCSAGSVQQGDKVLPLYQKQLQRGEKVLEQEISSFEFSLSLPFPSSSQTAAANSLLSYRAGVFAPACGTSRNLYGCLQSPCRVRVWRGSSPR